MLLFGIIEFGRIFQAWIAVQNAARNAARYASTGQYDSSYGDLILPDSLEAGLSDRFSIIPCEGDSSMGESLAPYYYDVNSEYAVLAPDGFRWRSPPLRASLYHDVGKDCEPQDPDDGRASPDQLLRTDLLRLPSIYAAASEGAGWPGGRPDSGTEHHQPNL